MTPTSGIEGLQGALALLEGLGHAVLRGDLETRLVREAIAAAVR